MIYKYANNLISKNTNMELCIKVVKNSTCT